MAEVFCDPATKTQINTAIGCLDITGKGTITSLLRLGTSIASGAALVLIFYGGIKIIMAHGDPKAVQAGKELITAAVTGLVLISLSVVVLNFFGIRILNLPGFATP